MHLAMTFIKWNCAWRHRWDWKFVEAWSRISNYFAR